MRAARPPALLPFIRSQGEAPLPKTHLLPCTSGPRARLRAAGSRSHRDPATPAGSQAPLRGGAAGRAHSPAGGTGPEAATPGLAAAIPACPPRWAPQGGGLTPLHLSPQLGARRGAPSQPAPAPEAAAHKGRRREGDRAGTHLVREVLSGAHDVVLAHGGGYAAGCCAPGARPGSHRRRREGRAEGRGAGPGRAAARLLLPRRPGLKGAARAAAPAHAGRGGGPGGAGRTRPSAAARLKGPRPSAAEGTRGGCGAGWRGGCFIPGSASVWGFVTALFWSESVEIGEMLVPCWVPATDG